MGDFSLSSSLSSSDLEMELYRYTHKTENYSAMESSRTPMAPSFFVEDLANEEAHHFLEFCSLCKKRLGSNHDIYMYRGDTPFCSEECRQEQIEMDEALEKARKVASLKKASSPMRDQQGKSTSSPSNADGIHIRASSVVAR